VGVQALRDGVAAEAAAGAGGKQRVGGASGAFGEPGLQQGLDRAADWDDALFASLAFAADGRAGAQADVGAGEAGEFGDAQSGLDGQGHHRLVTPSFPASWVGCREQGIDLGVGQEGDDPLVEPLGRDVQDTLDEQSVLRMLERGVGEQRPDRGQADVAGSGAVASFILQVVQERRHGVRVQVGPVQIGGSGAGALLDEDEQQAQRVAVGGDGARAGLALPGEPVGEERLQRGRDQGHDRAAFPMPSRRAAASASSSGAADKYQ
jgi:hypothetical protein